MNRYLTRIIALIILIIINIICVVYIDLNRKCTVCNDDLYESDLYCDLLKDSKNIYTSWQDYSLLYIEKKGRDNSLFSKIYDNVKFISTDKSILPGRNYLLEKIQKTKYPQFVDACNAYSNCVMEMKYYPVAEFENDNETTGFDNSFNAARSYNGNRKHKGTDIMTSNNKAGYFPVVSVCDGIITNMGWLELGGYRVGITSNSGIYYYYAHLDSYASGIKEGDDVTAGQFLGFMGDSGYGSEGTKGKFDVHLHFGIYVLDDDKEYAINPYRFLENVSDKKLIYKK